MHIFHITDQCSWNAAKNSTEYMGDTLTIDGFIHCCLPDQINDVLTKWFEGKENLIILELDPDLIFSPIKYENFEGGEELFPHIYGPINSGAVISERLI